MTARPGTFELPGPRPGRVAILGVGNDMNGDDGAGVWVARALAARLPATPNVLVVDGGTAPESFTGPIRRFGPELVVEIDAAHLDRPAGTVEWVDWHDADGMSASTHTLPPSVLAHFLSADLGCRVVLIGIQPATLDMGRGLSPEVAAAVESLADRLSEWLA